MLMLRLVWPVQGFMVELVILRVLLRLVSVTIRGPAKAHRLVLRSTVLGARVWSSLGRALGCRRRYRLGARDLVH